MKVTLEAVARAIEGTVVGDGSVEITGVAGIREAREGDLTFLANPRYESYLELTQASAVIVSENHRNIGKPLIQNPNPYLAFLKAVRLFAGEAERPCAGVHPTAVIADGAFGRAQVWRRTGKVFDPRPVFDAGAPPLPGFSRPAEFVL